MNPNLAAAVARFRDEVYANAQTIDPERNHDWHDIALGFMLACGIPREELSWTMLSNLSCGRFDKYLEPTAPTPEQWVQTVFATYPQVITVRLGYGWVHGTGRGATVWMDFVTRTGEHTAASQDAILPNIPDNVIRWVTDNIPLGEFKDYARPLEG